MPSSKCPKRCLELVGLEWRTQYGMASLYMPRTFGYGNAQNSTDTFIFMAGAQYKHQTFLLARINQTPSEPFNVFGSLFDSVH